MLNSLTERYRPLPKLRTTYSTHPRDHTEGHCR